MHCARACGARQRAAARSVVCPGPFFTWAAWTKNTMQVPSTRLETSFRYSPVLAMATGASIASGQPVGQSPQVARQRIKLLHPMDPSGCRLRGAGPTRSRVRPPDHATVRRVGAARTRPPHPCGPRGADAHTGGRLVRSRWCQRRAPPHHALARGTPANHAGPPQPAARGPRVMACPRDRRPRWAARPGSPLRERPGPDGVRPVHGR